MSRRRASQHKACAVLAARMVLPSKQPSQGRTVQSFAKHGAVDTGVEQRAPAKRPRKARALARALTAGDS